MEKEESFDIVNESDYNLLRHQVPWQYQESYILTGYRKSGMSIWNCMKTLIQTNCNETLNIWTHFCPIFLFAWILIDFTLKEFVIDDPFYWPLYVCVVGMMGFCIMSSLAHTFNALSMDSLYTCFYMDYAFISIYSSTSWLASYLYTRPLDTDIHLLNNAPFLAFVTLKICLISTFQCCCTFRTHMKLEHAIRASSFFVPWLNCVFPYIYRALSCKSPIDCDTSSVPYFGGHVIFILICAVTISTRFPERLSPGTFDFIGQSHQIMHVCAIFSSYFQMLCIKNEMLLREDELRMTEINIQYSKYTFHFLVVAVVLDVLTANLFRFISKNYYSKTNKIE
ncbi:membrane progestin receptor gamma-B-like [Clytia hemisphaerica]|uniref:Uncharacterized protein n=1 Tax=Clytia hemisphaerica TaxID=252671 RepID=A0A7M5VCE8_9CNID|eukprot:TCONS_00063469-protein